MKGKEESLLSLLSKTSKINKYKRYGPLPLRYAGGKSLAVGHVVEHIPSNVRKVVSPFFGGGAVEIALARDLGVKVLGFDIFEPLVNYWRIQLKNPKGLARMLTGIELDDETYDSIKGFLKKHWESEEPWTCKDVMQCYYTDDPNYLWAAYYWFNHNLSYGPGFLGWRSKIYKEAKRYETAVRKVKDFKCPNLSVAVGDFVKVMPKHRRAFMYLDPPYMLDKGSKTFKGIYPQRNFPVHHKDFSHTKLRQLLDDHKGGFVLSYNDCLSIRELYKGFKIVEVGWQYTMGQGETRIGKYRKISGASHIKPSHEILIIGEKK